MAVTHALGTKLKLEVKERQRSGGRGSCLSGPVSCSVSTSQEAATQADKTLEKTVQQGHFIDGTNEAYGVQRLTRGHTATSKAETSLLESRLWGQLLGTDCYVQFCLWGPTVVVMARKFTWGSEN